MKSSASETGLIVFGTEFEMGLTSIDTALFFNIK